MSAGEFVFMGGLRLKYADNILIKKVSSKCLSQWRAIGVYRQQPDAAFCTAHGHELQRQ